MFSTDVTSAEPTKLLTCDASAWGQVSEKRTHGWRGTGIRDCVPGSRATASCLQPLHKRGHSAPRPPRAAQPLPRAGGRAPRREMGHAEGHLGLFLQKLREGGGPTWGRGGQGRSPKRGRGMQARSPRHRRAQGRPDESPARRRGVHRPRRPRPAPARPVSSPPAGRAGGARACPTALFLIRAELASGPPRPLDPRTPGVAGLTFPARPGPAQLAVSSGPHPPKRVSGSSATRGAYRSAPRACAPPRLGPLAVPAFRRPSPNRAPSARAHCGDPGPSRMAAKGSAGSAASPAGWFASSAELSTHSC